MSRQYLIPGYGFINDENDRRAFLVPGFGFVNYGAPLQQEGFRWRDDDDDENSAAWLDTQDTHITRAKSTNTRLRILVNKKE